jgi:hypothetical protein
VQTRYSVNEERIYIRYEGESCIPNKFNQKEKEEIQSTIREFEYQEAFSKEFGKKSLNIIKEINEKRGMQKGKYLIKKYDIKGKDILAVKELMQAYFDEDPSRSAKPEIILREDKLIIESNGFCPILESIKIMGIDKHHTCPYSTRPYIHAMLRAANKNVHHKNTKWRALGDKICQEIFWIEE